MFDNMFFEFRLITQQMVLEGFSVCLFTFQYVYFMICSCMYSCLSMYETQHHQTLNTFLKTLTRPIANHPTSLKFLPQISALNFLWQNITLTINTFARL